MNESENELERALAAAAEDPTSVSQFYRTLLEAKLLVIDESPEPLDLEQGVLKLGAQLRVRHLEFDGHPHVLLFSSIKQIQAFADESASYVSLNARDLFGMWPGSHAILNPGAECSKQFVPAEIASLADGSIFSQHSTYVVPEETQISLGQPAEYPQHITDALKRFFSTRKDVRAAYLAHYYNPSRDETPCTLIGVDATGDWESLIGDSSLVLRQAARSTDVVDFIKIDGSETSRYMVDETKPFFRRKRFGLF